jgi:hypothetical protein
MDDIKLIWNIWVINAKSVMLHITSSAQMNMNRKYSCCKQTCAHFMRLDMANSMEGGPPVCVNVVGDALPGLVDVHGALVRDPRGDALTEETSA